MAPSLLTRPAARRLGRIGLSGRVLVRNEDGELLRRQVDGDDQAKMDLAIFTITRNLPGRSGPGELHLGSPYTVAVWAFAGCVAAREPGAGAVTARPGG